MGKHKPPASRSKKLWMASAALAVLGTGFAWLHSGTGQTPAADPNDEPPADTGSPSPTVHPTVSPTPKATAKPSAKPTPHPTPVKVSPSAVPRPTPSPSKTVVQKPPPPRPINLTKQEIIVNFVKSKIGDAYIWGATGPNAFDCSGLVLDAYAQAGIELPRIAADQSTMGVEVSLDSLQPGDILFWGRVGTAYHDAIYIGNGRFVGAENPGRGVVEMTLDSYPPSGARRII